MKKYILVNGKYRSGKDYFSQLLVEGLNSYGIKATKMSFADPLKDIIARSLNMTRKSIDYHKNNKSPVNIGGTKVIDFRTLLQKFGTEGMKEYFGNTVWVDLLEKRAEETDYEVVIVPDFRFLSEYRDESVTVKVINNDVISNDSHASENELNDFKFDYIIDNTGQPLLFEQVANFIEYLHENEFIYLRMLEE